MRRLALLSGAASITCFILVFFFKEVDGTSINTALLLSVFASVFLMLCYHRTGKRGALACFWLAIGIFAGLLSFRINFQKKIEMSKMYISDSISLLLEATDYSEDMGSYSQIEAVTIDDRSIRLHITYNSNMKLTPGTVFSINAKVSDAGYKYGIEFDSYYSKGIFLLGRSFSSPTVAYYNHSLRYLPKYLSKIVISACDALYSGRANIFMKALLLGDKNDLYSDADLFYSLSSAGIMHTVAVSGMHIAFVFGLVVMLIGKSPMSCITSILAIWFFVLMTGATPSAMRAGIMQTMLLLAPIFNRENDTPTSLLFALFLILAGNPFAVKSVGLQLSFAAVTGLMLFARHLVSDVQLSRKKYNRVIIWLIGIAASSLSVSVCTIPIMIYKFGYISILSPITNIICLPVVSASFILGYISCFFSFFSPFVGHITAVAVSALAEYICTVADNISSIKYSVIYINDLTQVFIILSAYLILLICIFSHLRPMLKAAIPISSIAVLMTVQIFLNQSFYSEGAFFSALNVGQGQCLVAFSENYTVVFDCGGINSLSKSGDVAVAYLKTRNRNEVDALVLTHFDADHANGVEKLMAETKVGCLVIPAQYDSDNKLKDTILKTAKNKGCEIREIDEDTTLMLGNITISLFPPVEKDTSNENCLSCIVSMNGFSALITGDSPKSAEKTLIDRYDLSYVDLLISGHHGSKYSSCEELLNACKGEFSVISSGYNTYGHPTSETIKRLNDNGYIIFRTDINGTTEFFIPSDFGDSNG